MENTQFVTVYSLVKAFKPCLSSGFGFQLVYNSSFAAFKIPGLVWVAIAYKNPYR